MLNNVGLYQKKIIVV